MWFSESISNLLSAWLGASVGIVMGIFGSLAGANAFKGKYRKLILLGDMLFIILGMICLAVALYALLRDQPFHVFYPFALIGVILSCVTIPQWFILKKIYALFELKKMSLKDLE